MTARAASPLAAGAAAQGTATFQGLGDLPGGTFSSQPNAVSGDGQVVVGHSSNSTAHPEAFRWTQETGMQGLGFLPSGTKSRATDVSYDGSVIVGESYVSGSGKRAVRWINDGQTIEMLGNLEAVATAIAADETIVGYAYVGGPARPFMWTELGGMTVILDPPPPGIDPGESIYPLDVTVISPDTYVLVGYTYLGSNHKPIRWTEAIGWELLNPQGAGAAVATNEDGSILAGYVHFSPTKAARWEDGIDAWTQIAPDVLSAGRDITPDGNTIVGGGSAGGAGRATGAFIWDVEQGHRRMKPLLEDEHGLDLNGWLLRSSLGVSDDGLTIVGLSCNPNGKSEAWIARLPAPCVADLNDDGLINALDLIDLLLCFGQPANPPCDSADVNGDATVNVLVLIEVLVAFGACP